MITFSNLSKADGSALINENGTIVQGVVFGPVDIAQSKANPEEAVIEIIFHPKVSIPSTSPAFDKIRQIEHILKSIFRDIILTELYPKALIQILVQEIHDSGSLLIATINACCCALLDAGIAMRCPVSAVKVTRKNSEFELVFDSKYNVVSIMSRGTIDDQDLLEALDEGKTVAKQSFQFLRDKVTQQTLMDNVMT